MYLKVCISAWYGSWDPVIRILPQILEIPGAPQGAVKAQFTDTEVCVQNGVIYGRQEDTIYWRTSWGGGDSVVEEEEVDTTLAALMAPRGPTKPGTAFPDLPRPLELHSAHNLTVVSTPSQWPSTFSPAPLSPARAFAVASVPPP